MRDRRTKGRQPAERRGASPSPRDQPGRALARRLRLFRWRGGFAWTRTRGSCTDSLLSPPSAAAVALHAHQQKGTAGQQGREKVAQAPRYLIRAATLMLGAVRVRAAGGSRDVISAAPRLPRRGPQAGVRSSACPRTCSAAPAAACGTPGRGDGPHWRLVPRQGHPGPENVVFRHGLTT